MQSTSSVLLTALALFQTVPALVIDHIPVIPNVVDLITNIPNVVDPLITNIPNVVVPLITNIPNVVDPTIINIRDVVDPATNGTVSTTGSNTTTIYYTQTVPGYISYYPTPTTVTQAGATYTVTSKQWVTVTSCPGYCTISNAVGLLPTVVPYYHHHRPQQTGTYTPYYSNNTAPYQNSSCPTYQSTGSCSPPASGSSSGCSGSTCSSGSTGSSGSSGSTGSTGSTGPASPKGPIVSSNAKHLTSSAALAVVLGVAALVM